MRKLTSFSFATLVALTLLSSCSLFRSKNERCPAYSQHSAEAATEQVAELPEHSR